jgi:molybdenum cofactor biosynthesis protein B
MTVSDSRTLADDKSGDTLVTRLEADGHVLADRKVVKDVVPLITAQLQVWVDDPAIEVVISTGGTGLTGRDVTPEAFSEVWEKDIPGFGELFRWISFQKIKTSTVQSRACAGVANGTYLFSLPGSPGACKDGWDEILHDQLDIRHKPCNFVELMPRLNEHLK